MTRSLHERWVDVDDHRLQALVGNRPDKPAMLFLHGYPDSQRVWREIMLALDDQFFVVSFDMRGVAGSGPPAPSVRYRMDNLIQDLDAVIDQLCSGSCHLVGHDWGSSIGWSYLSDARLAQKVLSWTSISGPHLGIWRAWMSSSLKSGEFTKIKAVGGQLLRSSYVLFLLAWPLPELFWRLAGVNGWRSVLKLAGVPAGDPMLIDTREGVLSKSLRPLSLYRQNVFRKTALPELAGIKCPVQLLIATDDPFVSARGFDNLDQYVENLNVKHIGASHWAPRSHGDEVVSLLSDFAAV